MYHAETLGISLKNSQIISNEKLLDFEQRRKAKENLKDYGFISVFKDRVVSEGFESLFDLGEKIGLGAQSFVYKCT